MASLARSLLAIAVVALLQVACAQAPVKVLGPSGLGRPGDWGGPLRRECVSHMFGRRSNRIDRRYILDPVYLDKQINEVKIYDPRRDPPVPGTILIGEEITVCSELDVHPHVKQSTPLSFDFFRITARHAQDPIYIVMYVERYIEVPGPISNESVADE